MSGCSPSISSRPLIQDQSRPSIVELVCESSNVGLDALGTRVEEDDFAETAFLEVFFGDVHLQGHVHQLSGDVRDRARQLGGNAHLLELAQYRTLNVQRWQ